MTIYWERCSICGRYHAVKQCTLIPDLMVCPYCCLACSLREKCPRPVWYRTVKPVAVKKPITAKKAEAKKVLMDLLTKLEEG